MTWGKRIKTWKTGEREIDEIRHFYDLLFIAVLNSEFGTKEKESGCICWIECVVVAKVHDVLFATTTTAQQNTTTKQLKLNCHTEKRVLLVQIDGMTF